MRLITIKYFIESVPYDDKFRKWGKKQQRQQ